MAYPETDDKKDKQSFGGRGGGGECHIKDLGIRQGINKFPIQFKENNGINYFYIICNY